MTAMPGLGDEANLGSVTSSAIMKVPTSTHLIVQALDNECYTAIG